MFGIKTCKECEDSPKTLEEFKLKLENDRIRLHIKYICFIASAVLIWLIATGTAKDAEFPNWVSFASTIASIILSVLAIIMSITGENKSEVARNQLEETSKKIDSAVESMKEINANTIDNISSMKETLKLLDEKIEDMDLHIQEYAKLNKSVDVTVKNNFSNSNTRWGNRNEKKVEY